MKKMICVLVAMIIASAALVPAKAEEQNNYIYAASVDSIDWEYLEDGDIVIIQENLNVLSNLGEGVEGQRYIYASSVASVDWSIVGERDYVVVPSGSIATMERLMVNENVIQPMGMNKPTTVYNVAENGRDIVEGYSNNIYDGFYTEYVYTGKDTYRVQMENRRSDRSLVMDFQSGYIFTKTYRTTTVPEGLTIFLTFSSASSNYEVTEDTEWFIRFEQPMSVSGYIE